MELHEFFCHLDPFPSVQDVILPDIDAPWGNEIIHNVAHSKMEVKYNATLLCFRCEDITNEFESAYTSGFQYFQPCLNQGNVLVDKMMMLL